MWENRAIFLTKNIFNSCFVFAACIANLCKVFCHENSHVRWKISVVNTRCETGSLGWSNFDQS